MPFNITCSNNMVDWSSDDARGAVEMVTWVGAHSPGQRIAVFRNGFRDFEIHSVLFSGDIMTSHDIYTCEYVEKLEGPACIPGHWAAGAIDWSAKEPSGRTFYRDLYHELLGLLFYFDDCASKEIMNAERLGNYAKVSVVSYDNNGNRTHEDIYALKAGR